MCGSAGVHRQFEQEQECGGQRPRHAHAVIARVYVGRCPSKAEKKIVPSTATPGSAGELLDCLEHSGGGSNFVHADSGQDEVEQLADARAGTESDQEQPWARSSVETALAPVTVTASTIVPAMTITTPRCSRWRPNRPTTANPTPIPAIIPTTIAISVSPAWTGEKCSPSWANSETQSSSPPNAPKKASAGRGCRSCRYGWPATRLDQRIAVTASPPQHEHAEAHRSGGERNKGPGWPPVDATLDQRVNDRDPRDADQHHPAGVQTNSWMRDGPAAAPGPPRRTRQRRSER